MTKLRPFNSVVIRRPKYDYWPIIGSLEVRLDETIRSDSFREALFYASPDLYGEFEKYLDGKLPDKEAKRMHLTLAKYLTRMTCRCTPFGAFSSCGTGRYAASTEIASAKRQILHFRYDCRLLCDIARRFLTEADTELLRRFSFSKNQTAVRIGNDYHIHTRNAVGSVEINTLKRTGLLSTVLRMTESPIDFDSLFAAVNETFEITEQQFAGYVRDLALRDVLLTSINPETVGFDNLQAMADVIPSDSESIMAQLVLFLKRKMESLNRCKSFAERKQIIDDIFSSVKSVGLTTPIKQIIQVDSYLDDGSEIDPRAQQAIIEILPLMIDTTLVSGNAISSFISRFSSRYESQSVPLLEALDPDIGIGYDNIRTGSHPLLESLMSHFPETAPHTSGQSIFLSPFEKIVLRKMKQESLWTAKHLTLTTEDFKSQPPTAPASLPLSMACMYRIVGFNDNGPVIAGLQFTGHSAASMLTRFADGSNEIDSIVRQIGRLEQDLQPDKIIAEISHLTEPHLGNVQCRPPLRDFLLTYLSSPRCDVRIIDTLDLYLKVEGQRLVLYSKLLKKEILPRFTSAYNYQFKSSALYRFLGDLQNQGGKNSLYFACPGICGIMGHLPRISFGNVILVAETWVIGLGPLSRGGKPDAAMFNSWCDAHDVARHIVYSQGDNCLVIDRQSPLSIEMLFSVIKKTQEITVEEFLPMDSALRHYSSTVEVLQPFIQTL